MGTEVSGVSLYLATERRQHFHIPHILDKISKNRKTLRPRPRLESGCRTGRGAGKEKEVNQTDSTESDEPGECLHCIYLTVRIVVFGSK